MKFIVLLGRFFYSAIFIIASLGHFSKEAIDYAAGQGVPMAFILVPVSGLLIFFGGLSILLGFRAKIGAWLVVIFLIPVTLAMHNFWAIEDAKEANIQQIMFMKNLALLGCALLITYFGSGPLSLDHNKKL